MFSKLRFNLLRRKVAMRSGLVLLSMLSFPVAVDAVDSSLVGSSARRLTPLQYRSVITDLFGSEIRLGGRFEPDLRVDGLLEVGTNRVAISPTGMEQYDAMARTIAEQIVGDVRMRELVVPCKPKANTAPDEACAKQFVGEMGRLLFRRPLTEQELQVHVGIANATTETLGDFYQGLTLALATMLESPQFLFRSDTLEPDPKRPGASRLDAYSKATRLSFFFWNSTPDELLLAAAASGELHTQKGFAQQVDRLIASPRLEAGVRAFFTDMLHLDQFDSITKDQIIYPKFSTRAAEDSQEQTLKTIVEILVNRRGDYRDLFTTKETFMTKALASIYKVPFALNIPNGSIDGWKPYTFSEDDPRAGILMQVSFVALHSHPGRSSPTLRGKALREILLCQKVPAPPGDVEQEIIQDTASPVYRTARDRLTAHVANPVCAGCHKITDPIGLALENFDGAGGFRTTENNVTIDTSGELDRVKFTGAEGLGKAMRDNPATISCLVNRLSSYALGRPPSKTETAWIEVLKSQFAKDQYRIPELMRRIATSEAFVGIGAPQPDVANQ